VVDDDVFARDLACAVLEGAGHTCDVAGNAAEAMGVLSSGTEYALVLCDIRMPNVSGLDLARHIVAEHPATAAIMVTGVDDELTAETALAFGVFGYVVKPYRTIDLMSAVSNALRRRKAEMESRRTRDLLERRVEQRTKDLRDAVRQLQNAAGSLRLSQEETMRRLARAIEFRSRETGDHIDRIGEYCALLGARLGLDPWRCGLLRMASSMHDVGKVAIPDRVLLKPGRLTVAEREEVKRHSLIGHEVLAGSRSEVLELAATIALTHHERWDGTGYPRGLAAEEIPLEGRIVAVADVFDALTHDRVYRTAMPLQAALAVLRDGHGSHFDPVVLDCFFDALSEVETIAVRHSSAVG